MLNFNAIVLLHEDNKLMDYLSLDYLSRYQSFSLKEQGWLETDIENRGVIRLFYFMSFICYPILLLWVLTWKNQLMLNLLIGTLEYAPFFKKRASFFRFFKVYQSNSKSETKTRKRLRSLESSFYTVKKSLNLLISKNL